MGRERRLYPRHPVHWEAEVRGEGFAPRAMMIRDFCAGGLFLEHAGGGPADGERVPAQLTITFSDPSNRQPCQCHAHLVRDAATGLAVQFSEPRPDVVTVLSAVAEGQATAPRPPEAVGGPPTSRLAGEAMTLCESEAIGFARRTVPDFVAHAIDELFEKARGAVNNAEQSAYFAGFRRLRDSRDAVPDAFCKTLSARIRELATGEARRRPASSTRSGNPSELALVDEDDFEDWLNRSEIVSHAESRVASGLDALTRRLGYITGQRLDEQSNPLSPTALSEMLADALPGEPRDPAVSRAVYRVFGRVVLDALDQLYDALNHQWRAQGILPGIEDEAPEIRSLGGERHRPAPPEESPETGETRPAGRDSADAPDSPAADGPAGPAARQEAAAAPAERPSRFQLNWERRAPASDSPLPRAQRPEPATVLRAHRALRTAREAGRSGQEAPNDPGNAAMARGAAESAQPTGQGPAAPAVTNEQLIEAIDRVQARTSTAAVPAGPAAEVGSTESGVLSSLGDIDLDALSDDTRDTLEVVDDWFGDLGSNALNTEFLRDWSGRMGLFALRVQLQSGEFLDNSATPIHALLDQLDRAGVALATLRNEQREVLRGRLEEILERVLAEQHERPDVVPEAAEEMGALIDRPMRARAANMQKVLQQCEGSQKLERARAEVNRLLDERIGGLRIPKLLLDFIDDSWRHLLVLLRLRTNGEGDHWRRAVAVVDRLLVVLGTDKRRARPIPQHEKVFAFIHRELKSFARLTPESEALLARLREYADHVCAHGRASGPLAMVDAPAMAPADDGAEDVSPHWLGQAKLLRVGDWMFFAGRDGAPEPLRLQWVDEERTRFVFVNRSGYKAREASLVELAQLMEVASAGVADDLDAPLTERQWQRKLQEMHEDMIRFATRDSLTDLLNRKSMTRELERIASVERAKQRHHALLYVAIDRFKVVNSTLGYEVGDRLLSEIGRHLGEAIGPADQVGRVGADEFAIYLADCTVARASLFAEEQRQRVQQLRVGDTDNSISVSVSVGLLPFQFGTQGAAALLKAADEACLAAKEAGGNQVHEVTPDDRELEALRGSMARAARVDRALESGSLQLRAQRIVPIADNTAASRPFYEVLVTMGSDMERAMSPAEFIPAAERFGRMPAVDRWVIRNTLDWAAAHPDVMKRIEGLTINLSGPTLANAGLAEYLRAEFDRTGVAPRRICFEVTETAAVQNLARAADLINEVRRLGCRFSLDDFGTGHASYAYLKNLPIDFLKIDGEFIRQIDHDEADFAMVRSINELAHYLGKQTIAEYVENQRILERLQEVGLDYAQGYGIGWPEPLETLTAD